jgi:hypothetical protein
MVDPRSVQTAQSRSRVVSQFEKFESKSPEHKGTKVKSKDTKNAFLRVLAVAVLCAFVPLCPGAFDGCSGHGARLAERSEFQTEALPEAGSGSSRPDPA